MLEPLKCVVMLVLLFTSCCRSLSWLSSSPAPPGVDRRSVKASRQRTTLCTALNKSWFTPKCKPSAAFFLENSKSTVVTDSTECIETLFTPVVCLDWSWLSYYLIVNNIYSMSTVWKHGCKTEIWPVTIVRTICLSKVMASSVHWRTAETDLVDIGSLSGT